MYAGMASSGRPRWPVPPWLSAFWQQTPAGTTGSGFEVPWGSIMAATVIVTAWAGRLFRRRLDGYTGDCLGATQQIAELAIYLALLAAWNFT